MGFTVKNSTLILSALLILGSIMHGALADSKAKKSDKGDGQVYLYFERENG
jgi:hypothetical protein